MNELMKKFSKIGSTGLSKKLESNKCTESEKEIIVNILIRRGIIEKVVTNKSKEERKPSTRIKDVDIVNPIFKIGDIVKMKSRAKLNRGQIIDAEIIKIYICGRTRKEFVRLKSDDRIYHKRLNAITHS